MPYVTRDLQIIARKDKRKQRTAPIFEYNDSVHNKEIIFINIFSYRIINIKFKLS
jgi:hypothetical protein